MTITDVASDLRQALRNLLRARGLAAVALGILAAGIALNGVVLSVVNAYLWKELPYPAAERLYTIRYAAPGERTPQGLHTLDWSALSDVTEHAIAWDLDVFFLLGGEHAESAPGAWVTRGFMAGLGIQPLLGRPFSPAEFQTGSPQVALISHSLWQKRFGGSADVLGRGFAAYVSDRPSDPEQFTIAGVLPADFWHVNPYTEILTPLRAATYPYMARLRPGVPVGEAQRRITEFVKQGLGGLPEEWQAQVRSAHGEYVARVRPMLQAVGAAAGLVLLIACANVAFLLLLRGARRKRELAVRMALGASRGQIARLLTAEALVLCAGATAAGLMLTSLLLQGLAPLVENQLGRPAPGGATEIVVDGTILSGAVVLCLMTALVFTLAPLLAAGRTDLVLAMQGGARSGTEGKGSRRARSALIALEVAASVVLLVGCALMLRTVLHLVRADLGYTAGDLLVGNLSLRDRTYPTTAAHLSFYESLLPQLEQLPGVRAVALANWPALQPPRAQPVQAAGATEAATVEAGVLAVSRGYFSALGIPLLEGRELAASDRAGAEPVALVSESAARRLWPQGRAVGQSITLAGDSMTPVSTAPRRVVGVVRDVRQGPADENLADVYVPLLEAPGRFSWLYVATGAPAGTAIASLRQALKGLDPEAALDARGRFGDLVDEQLARPRFLAGLLTAFGLFAALLSIVGVYGVITYATRQRRHEIAVRMAVGADARRVIGLFLRQGAWVLGAGVAAGGYGALAMGRLLESQLHGARVDDPATIAFVTLAFTAAGLAAVWWPARRASRTDPARVLRCE